MAVKQMRRSIKVEQSKNKEWIEKITGSCEYLYKVVSLTNVTIPACGERLRACEIQEHIRRGIHVVITAGK